MIYPALAAAVGLVLGFGLGLWAFLMVQEGAREMAAARRRWQQQYQARVQAEYQRAMADRQHRVKGADLPLSARGQEERMETFRDSLKDLFPADVLSRIPGEGEERGR